jgi:hypothetical protein
VTTWFSGSGRRAGSCRRSGSSGGFPRSASTPALPNLQVERIDPARVTDLAEQAVQAGVRTGADLGTPGVADAPTTRIDVVTAGGRQTVSAAALGEAMPDDPNLTAAQRAARAKLSGFVRSLTEREPGA